MKKLLIIALCIFIMPHLLCAQNSPASQGIDLEEVRFPALPHLRESLKPQHSPNFIARAERETYEKTWNQFQNAIQEIDEVIKRLSINQATDIIPMLCSFYAKDSSFAYSAESLHQVFVTFWQLQYMLSQPQLFRSNPHTQSTLAHALNYYIFYKVLLRSAELRPSLAMQFSLKEMDKRKVELEFYLSEVREISTAAFDQMTQWPHSPLLGEVSYDPWTYALGILDISNSIRLSPRSRVSFIHMGPRSLIGTIAPHQRVPDLSEIAFLSAIVIDHASGSHGEITTWIIDPLMSSEPIPYTQWLVQAKEHLEVLGIKKHSDIITILRTSNFPPLVHRILRGDPLLEDQSETQEENLDRIPMDRSEFEEILKKKLNTHFRLLQVRSQFFHRYRLEHQGRFNSPFLGTRSAQTIEENEVLLFLKNTTELTHFNEAFLLEMAKWIVALKVEPDLVVKTYLKMSPPTGQETYEIELMEATTKSHRAIYNIGNLFQQHDFGKNHRSRWHEIAALLLENPNLDLESLLVAFKEKYKIQHPTPDQEIPILNAFIRELKGEKGGLTLGCFAIPQELVDGLIQRFFKLFNFSRSFEQGERNMSEKLGINRIKARESRDTSERKKERRSPPHPRWKWHGR